MQCQSSRRCAGKLGILELCKYCRKGEDAGVQLQSHTVQSRITLDLSLTYRPPRTGASTRCKTRRCITSFRPSPSVGIQHTIAR